MNDTNDSTQAQAANLRARLDAERAKLHYLFAHLDALNHGIARDLAVLRRMQRRQAVVDREGEGWKA